MYATLCFFAGVLLTYLFELALEAYEDWLLARRTIPSDLEDVDSRSPDVEAPKTSTVVENDNLHIEHEVGHEGEMVAEVLRMTADDARALIRMGLFAGLALAFHVRDDGRSAFVLLLKRQLTTTHRIFLKAWPLLYLSWRILALVRVLLLRLRFMYVFLE